MSLTGPRDKRLSLLFLVLLTAVTLYLSFLIAQPFLTPILTAALLAVALHAPYTRLHRRIRNRTVAALLATILVFVTLLVPMVLIVNKLADETRSLYTLLNERRTLDGGGWTDYLTGLADRPLTWVATKTGLSHDQLRDTVLERLQNVSTTLLNWAKSLAVNLGATIADTFIMLFTLFFLLRDGERIRDRIGTLVPIAPDRYNELIRTISESVAANLYGVLAVAVAQGTLGAIGYIIAGLPAVMIWSVFTALFSMVPIAGAAAVWGVGVIYLLVGAQWGKAVFLLAYGAGVISMADNVVRPLVLSGKVKMNTLLVFFSILGGVQAFGIIGLFLGPVIVSVAMALLRILEEERLVWERTSSSAVK